MTQTEHADGRGVRETRYDCPVCAASHVVTEPSEVRLIRVGSAQRCHSGPSTTGP